MKTTKRLLLLLTILTASIVVQAVGPKVACILTFTPSTTLDVTGYWFYWRTATNQPYSDTYRVAISTNAYTGLDLRTVLSLPKSVYYVVMTATNVYGESDLSAEAVWYYKNPNQPADIQIKAP